jgi:hypothetical protein
MEEFEKSLPPGFREKIAGLMMQSGAPMPTTQDEPIEVTASSSGEEMNVREARMTILRAVAAGKMSPDEAEKLLF